MATKTWASFGDRGQNHPNALAKRLFDIAEAKQTNIVVSADLTSTEELLSIADALGPYIAVLKTHVDILSDFSQNTILGLTRLAKEHNFLIFEDRKFVDIGNTVQKQYRGGALKIYDWAHIVNAAVLAGGGIIDALSQTIADGDSADRGILILAEMTSKGSLAVGDYTRASVEYARKHRDHVLGFVATQQLSSFAEETQSSFNEDFVVFTTGISIANKGDALGQQYQSPERAMSRGADFLIIGRGIYSGSDPVASAKEYRKAGWDAYLARIQKGRSD